jgi:protein arginine kinase
MHLRLNGPFLGEPGPDSDVTICSRVRLARNLAGFPFVARCTPQQRHEVMNMVRRAHFGPCAEAGVMWVNIHQASPRERMLLVERHLVSRQFAEGDHPRAAAVSPDESLSIMVNEEDHLRMQVLLPGSRLADAFEKANATDDAIESAVDFAFDKRWGYLTACPTNVGCGIRFSVMLHLPALRLTNEIEKLRRAAEELHLAVRGFYGEGSESAGDFYQISNQVTLGFSEPDLLDQFNTRIVPRVVEYERQARRVLAEKNVSTLDDRIFRAIGVLRSARLIGVDEAMKLLSRVRLGVCLQRLNDIDLGAVNRLFLMVQPAHMQAAGCEGLPADELREARATLLRKALGA